MSRLGKELTRISTWGLALGALCGLVLMFGCGSGEESVPKTSPTQATPAKPSPPAHVALKPGDAAAGAVNYANFCASCHGDEGCGDGPVASTLDPKPAAHCDASVMDPLEDEYLVKVITEGGPAVGKSSMMAPWGGSLSEQDILDVVAYIRTLAH